MKRWAFPWTVGLGLVVTLACSDSTSPSLERPTLEELLSAPLELELGAQHLLLASDFILDRMPQTPPFNGFQGEVRVWERDQHSLPELELSRIWVILGEDVWEGDSLPTVDPQTDFELRWQVLSDRPWVNVMVQVVVELSSDDGTQLLRAENQWITGTI